MESLSSVVKLGAVLLISLLIWFSPIPWELSLEAWHLFALFFGAILAVLTGALPLLTAALFALALSVLTGVLPVKTAFSGFSQPFMLLILSAMLIAKAMIKSGLGRRIGMLLIRRFGRSTLRLAYCIVATDAIIAPAMPSNTARSGILYPIVNALALSTGSRPDDRSRKRTGAYLMMCGIAGITLSSALWLTGMAGNPIGVELARNAGVEIDFARWLWAAWPPCLGGLLLAPYALYRCFPPEIKKTPEAQRLAAESLSQMGPMKTEEWITLVVFLGMLILWSLAGWLDIDLATVALLGLAVLIVTNVYRLEDLRAEGGDALETYIWFSILYMLSSSLNDLGFMRTLGVQIGGVLQDLSWLPAYLLLTLLYVLIHYLFVSQTAHLLALYAVFLEVGMQTGVPAALMAFMLSFATNYFSAITPQGSGGNVVFVGSGYLQPREVYRYGALITLINVLIFLLATPWILWASA